MLRAYLLLLVFFFAACSSATIKKVDDTAPADLIPHEQMVKLMVDIHILESGINVHAGQAATENKQASPVPPFNVYKRYGVTRDQYDRSFRYYSLHLEEFQRMYDEVLSELNRIQAKELREASKK